ncbi:Chain length determinant protein [Algoriphagus ratkowskyi]|uniref:Chain length determinant protein n=1 Tax=Algoriphagus ratkowskyi TaxID=57028 RepID=A0A2W7RV21_9BACT|nr:exopolysaccharide biosynthesis protein [Algoriphagus ratkowskyi]PZX58489.1 Chain length determinant protein [Algoriphagus ratkowskyi]TXD77648.1 exopolysaccharide biosynthesis protein [Algoriphagus ratkowskyi]
MSGSKHFTDNQFTIKEVVQNFTSWIAFFISQWKILLLAGLIGLGLGALVSIYKKPVFSATTSFVLEDGDSGGIGQMSGLASLMGVNMGSMGGTSGLFQGDNIMELYRSDRMLDQALLSPFDENHLLIDRFIEFEEIDRKWASKVDISPMDFSVSRENFSVSQDSVVREIAKLVRENQLSVIKPDRKLTIIQVTVSSKDEAYAKAFNEHLVENVNEFYRETKTKKTSENLMILQSQADSVRMLLNESIGAFASATDRVPNANPLLSSATVETQKKQIDVRATGAVYEEVVKNLEIAKVNHRNNSPLIQIIDAPRFPLERSEIRLVKGMVYGAVILGMLAIVAVYFRRLYHKHVQES